MLCHCKGAWSLGALFVCHLLCNATNNIPRSSSGGPKSVGSLSTNGPEQKTRFRVSAGIGYIEVGLNKALGHQPEKGIGVYIEVGLNKV